MNLHLQMIIVYTPRRLFGIKFSDIDVPLLSDTNEEM